MYLSIATSPAWRTAFAYLIAAKGTAASQRFSQSPAVPDVQALMSGAFLKLRGRVRVVLDGTRATRRLAGSGIQEKPVLGVGDQRFAQPESDRGRHDQAEHGKLGVFDDKLQAHQVTTR